MQSCDPFGRNSITFGCERESHIPLNATPLGGQVNLVYLEAYQDSPPAVSAAGVIRQEASPVEPQHCPRIFTRRDWWFTVPFSAVQALGATLAIL
jgi:hypothetical protein